MAVNQDAAGKFLPYVATDFAAGTTIGDATKIAYNNNTIWARKPFVFAHEVNSSPVGHTLGTTWERVYFHAYLGPQLNAPVSGLRSRMLVTVNISAITGDVDFRAENAFSSNDLTSVNTTGDHSWVVDINPGVVDAVTISAQGTAVSQDLTIKSIRLTLQVYTTTLVSGYEEGVWIPQDVDFWDATAQPLSTQILREVVINNENMFHNFHRVVGCHNQMHDTAAARLLLAGSGTWSLAAQHIVWRRDPAARYIRLLLSGYTLSWTGGDAGASVRAGFTSGASVTAALPTATAPDTPGSFQIDELLEIPTGMGPHILYIMGQRDDVASKNGVIWHYSAWEQN